MARTRWEKPKRRDIDTVRHRQPSRKGTQRIPRSSAMLPELDSALQDEMNEFHVSRSWITAIAIARHLHLAIPHDMDYRNMPWKKKSTT
jgi:hypothetical protein